MLATHKVQIMNEPDKSIKVRIDQLESDIMVLAEHLGYIRSMTTGELVHKDTPATKADGDALIKSLKALI